MSTFAFSNLSRRRFSRGEAKGMTRLCANMWACLDACGARKGWERILARVGRSSASASIDDIKVFASFC